MSVAAAPLNPYQPNQRMNTPRAPIKILCPRIGLAFPFLSYLPLVLTLFGNYYGTILKQGFYYVNPFATYNNPAYMNALEKAKAAAASVETEKGRRGSSGSVKVNAKKTISLKDTVPHQKKT